MSNFLPYGRQSMGEEELALVKEVLASDWLTQGPRLGEFEEALAAFCGARFAVTVSNGTAALHLACLAAGLEKGDRFLTTPLTFAATANAALMCGADPVFVDVQPGSLNLDPDLVEKALKEHPDIKVMLPVHFGGLVCDLDRLAESADRHGVTIIEDACHAIGGHWQDRSGRWHPVGSCARSAMTCFSFHPVKSMTTGEGGAVTTNDPQIADRLRSLRSHGITRSPEKLEKNDGGWYYEMQELGISARLTDLQAAIGLAQLKKLPAWQQRRLDLVQQYDAVLAFLDQVSTQTRPRGEDRNCYHLMVIRTSHRRALYDHLHGQGILVQVHYIPVHLQPYYRRRFGTGSGDCPVAEEYYTQALSLPLFPAMTDSDIRRVLDSIKEFHGQNPSDPGNG
jgi:UDP-4-amino-4,6-dideoxy-N-acetyl-beta-L-altrosamine transaminase